MMLLKDNGSCTHTHRKAETLVTVHKHFAVCYFEILLLVFHKGYGRLLTAKLLAQFCHITEWVYYQEVGGENKQHLW